MIQVPIIYVFAFPIKMSKSVECSQLSKHSDKQLQSCRDCISKIACRNVTYDCYNRNCGTCSTQNVCDSMLYETVKYSWDYK